MSHRIAIICPTRGQPVLHRQLAASFLAHRRDSTRLVFAVPAEQRELYQQVDGCEYMYHPFTGFTGMTKPMNWAAAQLLDSSDTLIVVGNDVLIRTGDWEAQVIAARQRSLVVYPNDGVKGEELGTASFLDSRIVAALGYAAPPSIRHLFIDNFWMALGRALKSLEYLPGVMFEHIHPLHGRRAMDEVTAAENTKERYASGRAEFYTYMETGFTADVEKVKAAL